jgi:hypothetical protein
MLLPWSTHASTIQMRRARPTRSSAGAAVSGLHRNTAGRVVRARRTTRCATYRLETPRRFAARPAAPPRRRCAAEPASTPRRAPITAVRATRRVRPSTTAARPAKGLRAARSIATRASMRVARGVRMTNPSRRAAALAPPASRRQTPTRRATDESARSTASAGITSARARSEGRRSALTMIPSRRADRRAHRAWHPRTRARPATGRSVVSNVTGRWLRAETPASTSRTMRPTAAAA